MKQKISPAMAVVIVVVVGAVLVGLFYKLNFAGPPAAPPIPKLSAGGNGQAMPMGGGAQGTAGLPGAEKGAAGGAPTPGGGMMAPTLPGGGMTPGGGGTSVPTGPPMGGR